MTKQEINFQSLFYSYSWKEIPNCPGRYLLTKNDQEKLRNISPNELLNNQVSIRIFSSEFCQDPIHLGRFVDGGLISYEKQDHTFIHTLNNLTGLQRKIDHLKLIFD